MDDQELRNLLATAFEYAYLHEDWVFPLADALEGISAEQGQWRPGPGLMGIRDIVLHVAVWNENMVERIETGRSTHPAEGAWPPLPLGKTEEEWIASKTRLWNSIEKLKTLIETVSIDQIRSSPYGFPDLICRFTHIGYHLGQIEKLRECKGW